jgi:4-hydroxybenzoate polyprenyltransferase
MQSLGEACGHGFGYGKGGAVTSDDIVPDSEQRGLIGALPAAVRPYASLIRLDRPIGAWLLFWPGAWSVALARPSREAWLLILWLALGAWAMRSAGCVYNDIIDKDLDARVERTRLRPLASKRVSLKGAWALLIAMSLIGLIVLLQLDRTARIVALVSLAPVAAYPFMKRITWWPQAWLGLTFNWGALLGFAAAGHVLTAPAVLLYASGFFWTLGYDTIYAIQDLEDDALAGVKSSALRLGPHAPRAVAVFYAIAVALAFVAAWIADLGLLFVPIIALYGVHLMMQASRVQVDNPKRALVLFKSNATAGLILFVALALGAVRI